MDISVLCCCEILDCKTDNFVSTGQDISGYNMFAYCGNNPVNRFDSSGMLWNSIKNFCSKIWNKIKTTVSKIADDVKNFDLKNTSERAVLDSNYFSAYKGTIAIRTNGERSGSFGALFITRETNNRENENIEDIVRHEYVHTEQLKQLGVIDYALCIGVPSLFEWGNEPSYYDRPWEVTAYIYGGVISRTHSDEKISAGFDYLEYSDRYSILAWTQIEWD